MARRVHVVAHTHWDREWYDPFPAFRIRLVELLDELLVELDEGDLAHFQLDGQMAVVDDYLAVRPEQADRLRSLNERGRLSMGPWYVLPDEFLVSAETLVRNLQLGLRRAGDFGGAMQVGYLPDMFGHVAAMPQILQQFGLDHAVVWRGVPAAVAAPAFRWVSPDGSAVRAEYLSSGYFNGSDMPDDAEELRERIDMFVTVQGDLVGDELLWMAGMDHEVPPPHLDRVVAALDSSDSGYSLRVGSLADYLGRAPVDGLRTHRGELRSGARSNLLMGVASNRVDVKIAAAVAERALERHAEPMCALWAEDPTKWRALIDLAWLEVIRNAAHDSICACSHDEVVDAVLHRYAEATRTAIGVAERAAEDAASRFEQPGTHLLNPSVHARREIVEVELSTEPGADELVQVLWERPSQQTLHTCVAAHAPILLARELLNEQPQTESVRLETTDRTDSSDRSDCADRTGGEGDPRDLVVHLLPRRDDAAMSPMEALGEVGRRCDADPAMTVRTILHHDTPLRRVLAVSPRVEGFGWHRFTPTAADASDSPAPVEVLGAAAMSNGLIEVDVDLVSGTFSIDGVGGYGQLVDDGDAGDTYNWSPPDVNPVVDSPDSVQVDLVESGPLRARISIRSDMSIPAEIEDRADGTHARVGRVTQHVHTMVELRAGEPFVRVQVDLDHQARDHRLRVLVPVRTRARTSVAECAFGLVERGLSAEGGPNEWGVATYPSRRFVSAGGVSVTHEGLCEYELVDLDGDAHDPATTAGALALTLVRATGWLSRGPMASRPLPAGPEDRLVGSQCRGPLRLRFAVSTDSSLDPHELADRVWSPLIPVEAPGGGDLAEQGSHLDLRGAAVDALFDDGGTLVVRCHEPDGTAGELHVPGRTGELVDLRGETLGRFDSTMALRPHQLVTIRLDPST